MSPRDCGRAGDWPQFATNNEHLRQSCAKVVSNAARPLHTLTGHHCRIADSEPHFWPTARVSSSSLDTQRSLSFFLVQTGPVGLGTFSSAFLSFCPLLFAATLHFHTTQARLFSSRLSLFWQQSCHGSNRWPASGESARQTRASYWLAQQRQCYANFRPTGTNWNQLAADCWLLVGAEKGAHH